MLNRSASLAMSTCILKTLPGKLDIKRHSPSILYLLYGYLISCCIYLFPFLNFVLLKLDLSVFENTEDPDQLASDKRYLIRIHFVFHFG